MWGSGGSGKVLEGPGIPKGRKSQPEVNELYRRLLKCHVMTWGFFGGSWRVLQDPDDSKGDLEGTGGWGVSFRALDVIWGFGGPGGFGRVPKEFLEALMGVKILRVSWSITLWPEGSSEGSRRVLYDPSHSKPYFFQQFKIQIWFEDISSFIALSEDFEYSFCSFLCQFSNEWCGRIIEWIYETQ